MILYNTFNCVSEQKKSALEKYSEAAERKRVTFPIESTPNTLFLIW